MTITIWFKGFDEPVVISPVQSIELISKDVIKTSTFGNGSVLQRGVSGFTVSYNVTPSHTNH